MRIIISGGGTGGHIYPAITLIRAIQEKNSAVEFLYVGTGSGHRAQGRDPLSRGGHSRL